MSSKLIKILSVMLVLATVFALTSCSLFDAETTDEESTTEAPIIAKTELPTTTEEILTYFNGLMNNLKVLNPGVTMERRRDIRDVSATNSKGDIPEVSALISLAKGFIEELDKTSETSEYGKNLANLLPISGMPYTSLLTVDDILSAECVEMENDDHYYVLTIVLKDAQSPVTGDGSSVSKAFDLDISKSSVLSRFRDYATSANVSDYDALYTGCSISLNIFKETDQVTYINYNKNVIVTSDVVFGSEGDTALSAWGETAVSLNFTETKEFKDFVWEAPTTVTEEAE